MSGTSLWMKGFLSCKPIYFMDWSTAMGSVIWSASMGSREGLSTFVAEKSWISGIVSAQIFMPGMKTFVSYRYSLGVWVARVWLFFWGFLVLKEDYEGKIVLVFFLLLVKGPVFSTAKHFSNHSISYMIRWTRRKNGASLQCTYCFKVYIALQFTYMFLFFILLFGWTSHYKFPHFSIDRQLAAKVCWMSEAEYLQGWAS